MEKNERIDKLKKISQYVRTIALKIYPTSPIVTVNELNSIIDEIFKTKDEFDKNKEIIIDDRKFPTDFVYR